MVAIDEYNMKFYFINFPFISFYPEIVTSIKKERERDMASLFLTLVISLSMISKRKKEGGGIFVLSTFFK